MDYSEELRQVQDFVEGRLEPKAFEKSLYEMPGFEGLLSNDPNLPVNSYVKGSVYLFVLQQNFDSPTGVYNAQGALKEFLERQEIVCEQTKKYRAFFNIILSAQPSWLHVDAAYIEKEIMPAVGELSGKELQNWLKTELLKRFKYLSKPPKWIQAPNWPIGENGPLIFFGQVPVKNYFHDDGAVYVFYDPKTGQFENIIQVY